LERFILNDGGRLVRLINATLKVFGGGSKIQEETSNVIKRIGSNKD
jgi:hypothetical protein